MKRVRGEVASPGATVRTVYINDKYDDDLVQCLVDALPDLSPTADDIFNSNMIPEDLSSMNINDLMQYAYMEVKLIIEWARKVPGEYCTNDKFVGTFTR